MGIFRHLQDEIEARDERDGITLAELLDLSPPIRRLLKSITREGEMSAESAASQLGETRDHTVELLNGLVEKGYLEREQRRDTWHYRIRFARKRPRSLPPGIWSALGSRVSQEEEE